MMRGSPSIHASPTVSGGVGELATLDWDFPGSVPQDLHSLHPYPAKFIPEIPKALIAALAPRSGTCVFDPFCGSGTTLVEAQRAGMSAVGVDLNPIAVLLSRVKTEPLPESIGKALAEVTEKVLAAEAVTIPEIPRLNHWFKPDVQDALARLGQAIHSSAPENRDILRLAMSSIIVRVSNQDSDTRYAAVPKKVVGADVLPQFAKATKKIVAALMNRAKPSGPSRVIEGDILKVAANQIGDVGLVVTSPPYPNAYEYWLYHKYRMWWLGFDPLCVKEHEIGARAHFFGPKKHDASDFARQMAGLAEMLREVLVRGGHACFVVGRSRIHGQDVDNAGIIADACAERGMELVHRIERAIRSNRKSFNLSHANIKTETILVLRRN
ncbi:DNA methyltransferase [Bosea sp. TWI1241]|uniref:DNA methyltransferase n=1 Tax=Bosea sp. TWI1241 TaxID=3148904 RepID=UPI00320A6F8B